MSAIALHVPSLEIWRTFTLDRFADASVVLRRAREHDVTINRTAREIFSKTIWGSPAATCRFSLVTAAGLEADYVPVSEFCEAFRTMPVRGFAVDVAVALRFAYLDQPLGETLRVMLDPLSKTHGSRLCFIDIGHDQYRGLHLDGNVMFPSDYLPQDMPMVLKWVEEPA